MAASIYFGQRATLPDWHGCFPAGIYKFLQPVLDPLGPPLKLVYFIARTPCEPYAAAAEPR